MTVAEYLGKKDNEPEFFTVEELRDRLNDLITDGYGRAVIVLEKCCNPESYQDESIFADKRLDVSLYSPEVVRLNLMSPDDDAYATEALNL